MQRNYTLLSLLCIVTMTASSQAVFEWGVKPTELLFRNIEGNFGVGDKMHRYGIFLAYRPSTQKAGLVNDIGAGSTGGYEISRVTDNLYNAYTTGFYYKTYAKKHPASFYEVDAFYRNWNFKHKYAEFNDAEGYRFKGDRSENVDVYGLKLLAGQTFLLSRRDRKTKLYIDFYGGVGIRYQSEVYQTFNGTVDDVYYNYRKDMYHHLLPSLQGGIRIGLLKTK